MDRVETYVLGAWNLFRQIILVHNFFNPPLTTQKNRGNCQQTWCGRTEGGRGIEPSGLTGPSFSGLIPCRMPIACFQGSGPVVFGGPETQNLFRQIIWCISFSTPPPLPPTTKKKIGRIVSKHRMLKGGLGHWVSRVYVQWSHAL